MCNSLGNLENISQKISSEEYEEFKERVVGQFVGPLTKISSVIH